MIVLNSKAQSPVSPATATSLTLVLAGAKTTLNGSGLVTYEDIQVGGVSAPAAQSVRYTTLPFSANGTTIVTVVGNPPAGYYRLIKSLVFTNIDTGSITAQWSLYDGTTTTPFLVHTLATLQNVSYEDGGRWQAYTVALATL